MRTRSNCKSGIVVCALIALAGVLLMAACSQAPAAQPTAAPAPEAAATPAAEAAEEAEAPAAATVLKAEPGDGLGGELSIAPFPVVVMQKTRLQLKLQDQEGKPVTGAKVMFDLTMPSMMMPTNQTDAVEEPDGVYSADVYFSMGGGWQVNCLVTRGEQQDRVVFSFDIN